MKTAKTPPWPQVIFEADTLPIPQFFNATTIFLSSYSAKITIPFTKFNIYLQLFVF
jgi:hypothetical protein